MIRKVLEKRGQNRILGLIILAILVSTLVSTAYAWSVSTRYVHTYQTSWSADDGYHGGQVEWYSGTRYIRAGDDYVKWNSYTPDSPGYLAMVYHAFQPNSDDCGDIRTGSVEWSWSNFPTPSYLTKGCGWNADNEWRVRIDGAISVGTTYFFQHLFKDTDNNVGDGEVTTNSYWVKPWGGSGPYHGKFCINSSGVYAASPGC